MGMSQAAMPAASQAAKQSGKGGQGLPGSNLRQAMVGAGQTAQRLAQPSGQTNTAQINPMGSQGMAQAAPQGQTMGNLGSAKFSNRFAPRWEQYTETAQPLYTGANVTPEQQAINQDYVTQTQKYYDANPKRRLVGGKGNQALPQAYGAALQQMPQNPMLSQAPSRGLQPQQSTSQGLIGSRGLY